MCNDTTNPQRIRLQEEMAQRVCHKTAESVRTTCSFARAERLLGREYHGRFLIELLQNAADAWRSDPRSKVPEARCKVAVILTEEPALLVANQGIPMTVEVIIESLGHIGASTKIEGEAIGHKGIGFKSVLEITHTPEIYSGLRNRGSALAVAFDSEQALCDIREASPNWNEFVAEVQGLDSRDELSAVPVLRYPKWVDILPAEIKNLAEQDFDTVVRLPFDQRFATRLNLENDRWINTVRAAMADVSDRILLLLGCFGKVLLEDRVAGSVVTIRPHWQEEPTPHGEVTSREVVHVRRNDEPSSSWQLFRRRLPDEQHLAGEIAVGIRLGVTLSPAEVLGADDRPSAPFHLFFPTRIASGMPFLLHGYFEVDAARTGFYRGSKERNQAILGQLAQLAVDAVAASASDGNIDLVSLVELIALAGEPDDPLARAFRDRVLDSLDQVAWVPIQTENERIAARRPDQLFMSRSRIITQLAKTFPLAYIECQIGRHLPDLRLSDKALELITSRQPPDTPDLWQNVGQLCRPGDNDVWHAEKVDEGFRALLKLFHELEYESHDKAVGLINGLRGDPASRLLPAVATGGGRTLLPIPDPAEGRPDQRSRLVMAPVRASSSPVLVPPDMLDLAFLPEGLLQNDSDFDRARPLGVRPFTVDNILDRLHGIDDPSPEAAEALVRFIWRLLAQSTRSNFGTRRSTERATVFDPREWFWCRPGRARDDTGRAQQQHERNLADIRLPCRDGGWRPAGCVAFGEDWAEWLADGSVGSADSPATKDRIAAYRALEKISPGDNALLGSPVTVLPLLDAEGFEHPSVEADDETAEPLNDAQRNAQRHAFLLRLGVWEVPPIEAFQNRETNRGKFPDNAAVDLQNSIKTNGGWQFGRDGWSGQQHRHVYLEEDYRFLWPLEAAAGKDSESLLTSLQFGSRLYSELTKALVFCPGCRDAGTGHTTWRSSNPTDPYPSSLSFRLRRERWIPATLDGTVSLETSSNVWWHPNPPAQGGLRQSPWRFVPLCGPSTGMDDTLGRLAGVNSLDTAGPAVLESLLSDLRCRFENQQLPEQPANSGVARQAFIGLHRLIYDRHFELANEGRAAEVAALLNRTGVLCYLGDGLEYRPPGNARHDDGRFSAYVRYFTDRIPFVAIARDRGAAAVQLGIARFEVALTRRGEEQGSDVTDELRGLLHDRIAELLAIVVHHSLGAQTIAVGSEQFEERVRRLRSLSVRQVGRLVVDAQVVGTDHRTTIGQGASENLFLEAASSASPVLYHDLTGDGWQDRLRRKIAPFLAAVLESPAYAHTFALFLQSESDDEREEFLIELGISSNEVDAIAAHVGIVSEQERTRHRRWFQAILQVLDKDIAEPDLHSPQLIDQLMNAGLSEDAAHRLVDQGGGEAVRRDTGEGGALRVLNDQGVDLRELHRCLRALGDSGLDIKTSRRVFEQWFNAHWRRVVAVLATVHLDQDAEHVKAQVRSLIPPDRHAFSIDPPLPDLLAPVVELLGYAGLQADVTALVEQPETELCRLGSFESVETLNETVNRLFDAEERQRVLRERAAQWNRETRFLAVLARTGPMDTRATIRKHDEEVCDRLPSNPTSPRCLANVLPKLFAEHIQLSEYLDEQLIDAVTAPVPNRNELLAFAEDCGIAVERRAMIERALEAPRRAHARALQGRAEKLTQAGVQPVTPIGLQPPPPEAEHGRVGPRRVPKIKIDETHNRRKRELGDEGEQWGLAAALRQLLDATLETRDAAISAMVSLLDRFEGKPVEAARSHAELARARNLDEEELIDELTGLIHVSRHSDAFGFDLIGWLPPSAGAAPVAMCIEVKSSAGGSFHLSRGEWTRAQELHDANAGDQYAVLVVHRSRGDDVPGSMDLLVDPIALVESGRLRREADGYQINYRIQG